MQTLDPKHLEVLLEEGKYGEAKNVLEGYFSTELTEEEKGAAYVDFARIYMEVMTKLNKSEEALLDEEIAELKAINAGEKDAVKNIDLNRLKKDIKGE